MFPASTFLELDMDCNSLKVFDIASFSFRPKGSKSTTENDHLKSPISSKNPQNTLNLTQNFLKPYQTTQTCKTPPDLGIWIKHVVASSTVNFICFF